MDGELARIKGRISDKEQLTKYADSRDFRSALQESNVKYEIKEHQGSVYFEFFI